MPRRLQIITRHLPQRAKHQVILASAICDIAACKGAKNWFIGRPPTRFLSSRFFTLVLISNA